MTPPLRSPLHEFIAVGVTSPGDARAWEEQGLRPDLIEGFVRVGVTPTEALKWLWKGFTDEDVEAIVERGITVDEAESEERASWSEVFSRSSVGDNVFALKRRVDADLFLRFWYAVACLTISTWQQGGMFNSLYRDWNFADGGVEDVEPYGFGTHGGTWVWGNNALRLICARMGLSQPRRLKGEQAQPELAGLANEWAAQPKSFAVLSTRLLGPTAPSTAQPSDPAEGRDSQGQAP